MLYLLGGSGLIIVASGGWLAHAGPRYFARLDLAEHVAGLLIIAGVPRLFRAIPASLPVRCCCPLNGSLSWCARIGVPLEV
jgi:hypothetical protein